MLGTCATVFLKRSTRSSVLNIKFFDGVAYTPIATSSKIFDALIAMSAWPFVTGSKLPAYKAFRHV